MSAASRNQSDGHARDVWLRRARGKETIEWHCPACDEWGVINNWRGSRADLSRFATSEVTHEDRTEPGHGSPAFLGHWRITQMELWSKDAFDLLGPAFFDFAEERTGTFRFIAVQGWLDCQYGERDGLPMVEFSWEGEDEDDVSCGRGWATIQTDGSLTGRFFFHRGDNSAFSAKRQRSRANRN